MLTGRPSIKLIAGIAVLLFADVLFATAINHLLATGTCSSTGYTEYGPAPLCPHGTGLYGAFLAGGIFLVILATFLVGSTTAVATMFVAMGVGALMLVVAPSAHTSIGKAFPLAFGGAFLVSGLAWAGIAGAYAWNNRPLGAPRSGPRRPSHATTDPGNALFALVAWAGALAAAIALTTVAANHASVAATDTRPAADITRASLPRPTGADVISPTAPASLFRTANLRRAIGLVADRFGADANVVAVAIYPGELQLVIAASGGQARRVSVRATGAISVGATVPFVGSRQAVEASQLSAAVPPRLARMIARRGGVPTVQLDRFVMSLAKTLAHWEVYVSGNTERFEALLTGGDLTRLSPGPARRLTGNQ